MARSAQVTEQCLHNALVVMSSMPARPALQDLQIGISRRTAADFGSAAFKRAPWSTFAVERYGGLGMGRDLGKYG